MRPDGANVKSICPRCGGASDDGLCLSCILETTEFMVCPDQIELVVCPVCGSILDRGRWRQSDSDLDELIRDALFKKISVHHELEDVELEILLHPRGSTRFVADVHLSGMFRGAIVHSDCQIRVRVSRRTCDRCSRISGRYFEGIVQVRRSERPPEESDLSEAREIAQSLAAAGYKKGDRLAFIQDIKDVRGGIDIIVGSTQLGRHIAKTIAQRFGGRVQESVKLVGCRDGKDIFRTTMLVRLPRLRKGDVIYSKGTVMEVVGFEGRRTAVVSLDKGERFFISEDEADAAEIIGDSSKARKSVVISVDESVVEVLDPESYRTVLTIRPAGMKLESGAEVKVLHTDRGMFLLY
ncbi:MAG: 60S ribosomal export protein NMD3 [Methanothrix sp.]